MFLMIIITGNNPRAQYNRLIKSNLLNSVRNFKILKIDLFVSQDISVVHCISLQPRKRQFIMCQIL